MGFRKGKKVFVEAFVVDEVVDSDGDLKVIMENAGGRMDYYVDARFVHAEPPAAAAVVVRPPSKSLMAWRQAIIGCSQSTPENVAMLLAVAAEVRMGAAAGFTLEDEEGE